jgi:hypothetical protein
MRKPKKILGLAPARRSEAKEKHLNIGLSIPKPSGQQPEPG